MVYGYFQLTCNKHKACDEHSVVRQYAERGFVDVEEDVYDKDDNDDDSDDGHNYNFDNDPENIKDGDEYFKT